MNYYKEELQISVEPNLDGTVTVRAELMMPTKLQLEQEAAVRRLMAEGRLVFLVDEQGHYLGHAVS